MDWNTYHILTTIRIGIPSNFLLQEGIEYLIFSYFKKESNTYYLLTTVHEGMEHLIFLTTRRDRIPTALPSCYTKECTVISTIQYSKQSVHSLL